VLTAAVSAIWWRLAEWELTFQDEWHCDVSRVLPMTDTDMRQTLTLKCGALRLPSRDGAEMFSLLHELFCAAEIQHIIIIIIIIIIITS
jgi:hypothetical protein